jgi:hypothetical protein
MLPSGNLLERLNGFINSCILISKKAKPLAGVVNASRKFVRKPQGSTIKQVMLNGATPLESDSVIAVKCECRVAETRMGDLSLGPCLDAEYIPQDGRESMPAKLPILTIVLFLRSPMEGKTSLNDFYWSEEVCFHCWWHSS